MAYLPEVQSFDAGIYQIETSDPVQGGPGGIANQQATQLANRTAFLKKQIDDAVSGALQIMTAQKLGTARTIAMTGDGSWSVSFDGAGNATAIMALAASGVAAGTYAKVTVDAKGRVTAGSTLLATDIPALDWSKITTGKPTTLAGYGITDGATLATVAPLVEGTAAVGVSTKAAREDHVHPKYTLLAADVPALDWSKITTGKPTTLAGYGITDGGAVMATVAPLVEGTAAVGVSTKAAREDHVHPKYTLVAADIPALDWSKITTGKPTTLAGYGITDAALLATVAPLVEGTAAVGVSSKAAREDHVHPKYTLVAADVPALDWSKITTGKPSTASGYNITLVATDIPDLDWSKITTGKPTALAGYGIADAVALAAFTGANQSLAANGYQKLPGGLIVQWGKIVGAAEANNTTVTFPIAFPNAALSVTGSVHYTAARNDNNVTVQFRSLTTTSVVVDRQDIWVASGSGFDLYFIAIGY